MKNGIMNVPAAVLLAALFCAGCNAAIPVPADKQDYIGGWRGQTMTLSIAPNGFVSWERTDGGFSESVSGPITKFDGAGFTVGAFFVAKEFKVAEPPVQQNGRWRMTVNGETLEKTGDSAAPALPDRKALIALVNDSFVDFGVSLDRRDFGYFYRNISRLWREQTTAGEIQAAFQSFIDNEIDLRNVTKRDPVFTEEPVIGDDGRLAVKGRYPTEPVTRFDLIYVYEHPAWKLAGFACRID